MKIGIKIINVTAVIIALMHLGINIQYLLQYLFKKDISLGYGYGYLLLYIFIPATVVGFALLAVMKWKFVKNKLRYISLLLFNILFSTGLVWYFITDANKVLIALNNMSAKTMENVSIIARNNQNLKIGRISPGKSVEIYCDCRNVEFPNDKGIKLVYSMNQKKIENTIIDSFSNLFDQKLEIRIVADSISYRSWEFPKEILWGRIENYGVLLPWNKIFANSGK